MDTECKDDFLNDKKEAINGSGNDTENLENAHRECEMLTKDSGENLEQNENKNTSINECKGSMVNEAGHENSDNPEEINCERNTTDNRSCRKNEDEEENDISKQRKTLKKEISPDGKWTIRTYSGYIVTITVHPDTDRPMDFESEGAQRMWDWATERNLSRLKYQIQTGEYIPDDAVVEVDPNPLKTPINKPSDLIEKLKTEEERRENVVNRQKGKIKCLENEYNLVQLILQIQDFFSGEHRVKAGLSVMDEVLQLDITPLMLKKNPFIVNTIYCLCRYESVNEQLDIDNSSCNNDVRLKAQEIYHKFQSLFATPEKRAFEEYFKEQYKLMWRIFGNDERRIYELVNDPTMMF